MPYFRVRRLSLGGLSLMLLCLCFCMLLPYPESMARVWEIPATDKLEQEAQEALLLAEAGDTVLLPEGRFAMNSELSMINPSVTLKGRGIDKTVLLYGEGAAGPQAIIASAANSRVEDLTIVDHPGDGIKMVGVSGVHIRAVKVEWTKKASSDNGAYGIYPVLSSNVLIEDSVVIGASDAGIYVGQSKNIIVRRNRVEGNVAGIEIENSQLADVYANDVRFNTGGILVFNLPHLLVQGGRGTRIFQNHLEDNNLGNFAAPGNSVAAVPQGTGMLILANDDIEIFENTIESHNTSSIALASFHILEQRIEDEHFDAVPENIYIHDNQMRNAGRWPFLGGQALGLIAGVLSFPHRVPHIAYDGIGALDDKGEAQPANLQGLRRLCLGSNQHDGGDKSYFGNLQLWKSSWWSPLPGSMNRSFEAHRCELPRLPQVVLDPPPSELPKARPKLSPEQVKNLCKTGEGKAAVNWEAAEVDCPLLADYGLFEEDSNPLAGARDGGFRYELTTPLFSDYASKTRFLFLPPGEAAGYQERSLIDLPLGTIIAKTFSFPADERDPEGAQQVVETRLLLHRTSGWSGLVYLWNKEGTQAHLVRGGASVAISRLDSEGRAQEYRVPNLAQCEGCHSENVPIGLKTGYLNRQGEGALAGANQLDYLAAKDRLRGLPPPSERPVYPVWNDPASGTLNARARTYLDINCAHCHSLQGKANTSALFLTLDQAADVRLGICKPPVAAGRGTGGTLFDIVPGKASESLLVERMKSNNAAIKMPELARFQVHKEGSELVTAWIDSLAGDCSK